MSSNTERQIQALEKQVQTLEETVGQQKKVLEDQNKLLQDISNKLNCKNKAAINCAHKACRTCSYRVPTRARIAEGAIRTRYIRSDDPSQPRNGRLVQYRYNGQVWEEQSSQDIETIRAINGLRRSDELRTARRGPRNPHSPFRDGAYNEDPMMIRNVGGQPQVYAGSHAVTARAGGGRSYETGYAQPARERSVVRSGASISPETIANKLDRNHEILFEQLKKALAVVKVDAPTITAAKNQFEGQPGYFHNRTDGADAVKVRVPNTITQTKNEHTITYFPATGTFGNGTDVYARNYGIHFLPIYGKYGNRDVVKQVEVRFMKPGNYSVQGQEVDVQQRTREELPAASGANTNNAGLLEGAAPREEQNAEVKKLIKEVSYDEDTIKLFSSMKIESELRSLASLLRGKRIQLVKYPYLDDANHDPKRYSFKIFDGNNEITEYKNLVFHDLLNTIKTAAEVANRPEKEDEKTTIAENIKIIGQITFDAETQRLLTHFLGGQKAATHSLEKIQTTLGAQKIQIVKNHDDPFFPYNVYVCSSYQVSEAASLEGINASHILNQVQEILKNSQEVSKANKKESEPVDYATLKSDLFKNYKISLDQDESVTEDEASRIGTILKKILDTDEPLKNKVSKENLAVQVCKDLPKEREPIDKLLDTFFLKKDTNEAEIKKLLEAHFSADTKVEQPTRPDETEKDTIDVKSFAVGDETIRLLGTLQKNDLKKIKSALGDNRIKITVITSGIFGDEYKILIFNDGQNELVSNSVENLTLQNILEIANEANEVEKKETSLKQLTTELGATYGIQLQKIKGHTPDEAIRVALMIKNIFEKDEMPKEEQESLKGLQIFTGTVKTQIVHSDGEKLYLENLLSKQQILIALKGFIDKKKR